MAESFLFNIAERVLEKLVNLSVEEARLAFNVETDLMKLKETMIRIKAVLLDAERQQHQNESLRLFMWKLRDIFYEAEDVIDDFKCEGLRKQMVNPSNISFKERFLSSCFVPLAVSFKMGHKIKQINHRFDKLKAEWNSFNLGQCTNNRRVFHRETHSFVDCSDVVGRDEDKENIIDLLMKPGEGRNIPVIPIVGIGGLGKTTLELPTKKQEWEDVGDGYLNELLSRCLIQKEVEGKDSGYGFTFKMHDLIHDLALDVSRKECKTVNCETEIVDKMVRHLSFGDDELLKVPQDLKKLKNVRTVIVQFGSAESESFEESVINICVSKFKYLRALKFTGSGLGALPKSIGTLKHLRDLDLSYNRFIKKLPSSFYKLWSLQRLSMIGIPLMQLPDSVQSLIELRYLEISIEAKYMKEIRAGCWPSLQYLGLYGCDQLECLPEGMQYLMSLRRLTLVDCRNLVSLPRSLKFLSKLEDLYIAGCWKMNLEMEPEEEEDKYLQFSLKTFSFDASWELTDLPRLLLEGSSSTLQQIHIRNCPNLVVLPAWLSNLTSLRKLEIIDCSELSALPEGMDCLTGLKQLIIKKCPELSSRYSQDGGADWHKIAHIQEVVITDDLSSDFDSVSLVACVN